jgi:hypothetical protein
MTVDSSGPYAVKKPYTPPRLVIYGDLNSITRANPGGNKNDHVGGKVKTN